MSIALIAIVSFAVLMAASSAIAEPATQPPMNNFNYAYYTCDNGAAFQMSYDSTQPTSAVMVTSNDNKRFVLKRSPVDKGVAFANGPVKFWTDGKTVVVDGTALRLAHCKISPS